MYAFCGNFLKEIKEVTRRFWKFFQGHRGVIVLLILELIFLYGQRIFYYDISIDSEIAISSQNNILKSWLAIDRFGLVATKIIFGLTRFVPQTSNILMILTLGFSAFFFDFCILEWRGTEKNYRMFYYIFPAAYISAPCLAEQFYFSLQSFEIAWAGLLCIMSVYCISRRIIFRESILWIFLGVCLMIWAFGSYQAFVGLFIAITVVSFLMCYQNLDIESHKNKEWFIYGIKYVTICIIGLIVYKLVAKLIQMYYHLESSYVNNMFVWKTSGISAALDNIKGDFFRIYLAAWDMFFQKLFLPILIFCSLLLLFRGWSMHRKAYSMYLVAVGLLVISPLFLTIVSGSYQPIRGQLVYPFVYAFCLAMITTIERKVISIIFCFIAFLASLYQGQTMTQLFHTVYMTYEQDKELASSLYKDIEKIGMDAGLDKYTVVFVGTRSANLPDDALKGDVIGHSFFEWDSSGYAGSTNRIIGFCKTLGYDMLPPSEEQAEEANQIALEMPAWPTSEGIQEVDDMIIVKLS